MESTTSGHRAVAGRIHTIGIAAGTTDGQLTIGRARSRALERSSMAADYAAFAAEVYIDLDPRGALERLVAGQVVHNAWKLKANLDLQAARDRSEKTDPGAVSPKARIRPTELDRAARSMRDALEALDYLRARDRPRPDFPVILQEEESEILSNEWPVVPCDESDDFPESTEAPEVEASTWRDRLVFDFDVSEDSPVVKGTWVTVSHVVSMIVDGWNWTDILRSHPELTEDDIRTCVAYAMSDENSAA